MSTERPTHATLFPGLSPEELRNAEEIFRRYFLFIARLCDRIAAEDQNLPALTEGQYAGSMDTGRTFINQRSDTDV